MMPQLKRNERLVSGWGARKVSQRLPAKIQAWKKRRVVDGFPMEEPFKDADEIKDYLHGERIMCLRCGKSYKALALHLPVHGWTPERYREHYNLPRYQGLTCESVKIYKKARAENNYATGIFVASKEQAEKARKSKSISAKQPSELASIVAKRNLLKIRRTSRKILAKGLDPDAVWSHDDYMRVASLMVEHDLTMKEVCNSFPSPSEPTCRYYAGRNNIFSAALEIAWETVSFKTQARGQCLGVRFRDETGRLLDAGLTQDQVAEKLGVSQSCVSQVMGKANKIVGRRLKSIQRAASGP
jgi:predicted transcriptional regulator